MLHDREGEFDFRLDGPRDGYGFSNNPVVFKRAGFDKVALQLSAADKRITVQLK